MKYRGDLLKRTGIVTAAKENIQGYGFGGNVRHDLNIYMKDVSGGGAFSRTLTGGQAVTEAGQRMTIYSLTVGDKQWREANPNGVAVGVINHDLGLDWAWYGKINSLYTMTDPTRPYMGALKLLGAWGAFAVGGLGLANGPIWLALAGAAAGAVLVPSAIGDFTFSSSMKRESKRVQAELQKMMTQDGA
jgi:hypothetical protein